MKNLCNAYMNIEEEIKDNLKSTLNKLTEFRFDIETKQNFDYYKNKVYQIDYITNLKIVAPEYGFAGIDFVCHLTIIENEKHDICIGFTASTNNMSIYAISNLQIETVYSERNIKRKQN